MVTEKLPVIVRRDIDRGQVAFTATTERPFVRGFFEMLRVQIVGNA